MNGMERRFVNLPASETYEGILHIMRTSINGLGNIENIAEPPRIKAVLYQLVKVDIQILKEDGGSTVALNFSLKRCYVLTLLLCLVSLAMAIITYNAASSVGFVSVVPIFLGAQNIIKNFREVVYRDLSRLEQAYSQRAIREERARWQGVSIDVDKLHKKLSESYLKRWSDTYVLEYKINEYRRQGFTYREALLKIADEEGFLRSKLAEEET